MGGQADRSGNVDASKLIDIIKNQFEMTIDIEKLIADIDDDGSGEIEYEEFKSLMSTDWVNSFDSNSYDNAYVSFIL